MPLELPGLYFDENRNRYFPESTQVKSSKPPNQPLSAPIDSNDASGSIEVQPRAPRKTPWHFQQSRLISPSYSRIMRESHQNLCFHYAHSSLWTDERIPTVGTIRATSRVTVGGQSWRLIGDSEGWLFVDKEMTTDSDAGGSLQRFWSPDWCLRPSAPITSISVSESRFLTTCLGPGIFSVQYLQSAEAFLLHLRGVNDIRTSYFQGKEVVLGAKEQVLYIQDIDHSPFPQRFHTTSDVFSVLQKTSLVYAGQRNGTIERFDIRVPSAKTRKLFDHRFGMRARSTVLKLDIIQEHGLLLSHLDGDLSLYDLRFLSESRAEPTTVFEGHVNKYLSHLGMAVDPNQEFLFAAGQDCRLRAWSLRTGLPLSSEYLPDDKANPFNRKFFSPISALQVTRDERSNGVSLWAAYDRDLCQFHLGERRAYL